jgi:hypothetical protein
MGWNGCWRRGDDRVASYFNVSSLFSKFHFDRSVKLFYLFRRLKMINPLAFLRFLHVLSVLWRELLMA